MPDEPPPQDKQESVQETLARLRRENPTAHADGCTCWVCKEKPEGGI